MIDASAFRANLEEELLSPSPGTAASVSIEHAALCMPPAAKGGDPDAIITLTAITPMPTWPLTKIIHRLPWIAVDGQLLSLGPLVMDGLHLDRRLRTKVTDLQYRSIVPQACLWRLHIALSAYSNAKIAGSQYIRS